MRLWAIWSWDWLQTNRTINHAVLEWRNVRLLKARPYSSCLFYIREGGDRYQFATCVLVFEPVRGNLSKVAAFSLPHWFIQHWHFLPLTLLLCGVFACNTGRKCVSPRGSADRWQLDCVAESWLLGIRANASFRILIHTELQINYCSEVKLDRDLEKDMLTSIWNEETQVIITAPPDRCCH